MKATGVIAKPTHIFFFHKNIGVLKSLFSISHKFIISTLQPLYNMVHYNTVLDITRFKDGYQKCIDYSWSFFNIIYIFLFGYNTVA